MKINEKIKNSLFLKIILLFLAAHLTIATVGYTMHKYFASRPHHSNMDKNMARYSAYLIEEIGLPPDTSFAETLADSLHLAIQFTSPDFNWSSEPFPLQQRDLNWKRVSGKGAYAIAFEQAGLVVKAETGRATYLLLFKSQGWDNNADMQWRILSMVLFMMFILTLIYFIIRRLLQPIEQLDEATKQLSAGNLNYQLASRRKDELGDLVRSFNLMTSRIKEMLKAREQLLLDTSHELRSPLTRIKVALEFLENSNATESIRSDISDMEMMIAELLEKERLDSPYGGLHKTAVNLNELLQTLCATYAHQKPGLELRPGQPTVVLQADEERLRMALNNVLQNAFKFSGAHSKAVQVQVQQNGPEVTVTVRDFGQGLSPDEIPFIFEPFYRVDKSRSKKSGGYGLGLSLVKKIIEMHGGQINVDSMPGKGTTVKITLKTN